MLTQTDMYNKNNKIHEKCPIDPIETLDRIYKLIVIYYKDYLNKFIFHKPSKYK